MALRVGDLFAGIGGIALGLRNAGCNVVWANEMDANACVTYRANFKHRLYECPVQDLDPENLPPVDMLAAGFPCQAFSIAGYRKGFKDTRGTLFFEIMRLADALNPDFLFLENVKNLEKHDNGDTFRVILNEIRKRNFFVKYKVINTCEYSAIPQNRERIYIVAFKNKKIFDAFAFPDRKKHTLPVTEILEKNADAEFYYTEKFGHYDLLKKQMDNRSTVYQWRRVYLRENKNNLCPTLTANMGMGGHNVPLVADDNGIRKLTPRECARFQGFPDTYKLPKLSNSHLYKQLGNSVSVPVVESIGKEIIKAVVRAEG